MKILCELIIDVITSYQTMYLYLDFYIVLLIFLISMYKTEEKQQSHASTSPSVISDANLTAKTLMRVSTRSVMTLHLPGSERLAVISP